MMKAMISQYVRTMFDESRGGELTVGNDDDRFDYPVEWDEETADMLAEQCGALVAQLAELSHQYEKLKTETRHLTEEQLEIWNTYLKLFPKHGLDMTALESVTAGRTCLMIAHRLSTVHSADMILVVKNGRIVEQGKHSDLLKRRGYYHELYTRQYEDETTAKILT